MGALPSVADQVNIIVFLETAEPNLAIPVGDGSLPAAGRLISQRIVSPTVGRTGAGK